MILDRAGIALAEGKRQLVISRLARRLRHHGFSSFTQYIEHLDREGEDGAEQAELLNAITTNKTDFFREGHHFQFLRAELTRIVEQRVARGEARRLRIWSSACSSGEEPYSIAMTLREAFGEMRGWDVKILASDLDTAILGKAQRGVYDASKIADVPASLRSAYFEGLPNGQFRARSELRDLITFRQLNLNGAWGFRTPFDAIFCRNVIIYFNRETQDRLFRRMSQCLDPDGFLFLGHSESLHWMPDLYRPAGRTIYRLHGGEHAASPAETSASPASAMRRPAQDETSRSPQHATRPPRVVRPLPAAQDPDEASLPKELIHIGGVFASSKPAIVRTVLGSCVSVCLYDPERRIGGMNHFMLPESQSDDGLPTRYGVHAMELLINEIMKLGGDRRSLKAKLMGAAHVLRLEDPTLAIGERNMAFAREFLARERIPIVAERLGGTQALQVLFFTHSGKVKVRALGQERVGDLVQEELRYRTQVTRETDVSAPAGDVTLF